MKTAIFLMDNCFGSGIHAILDALIASNYALIKSGNLPIFEWDLVSLDGKEVKPTNGLAIKADYSLGEYQALDDKADAWLIPAVFQSLSQVKKVENALNKIQEIIPEIKQHHDNGGLVVTLCSGSFLLAEAGLLDDKPALMHWKSEMLFHTLYPHIEIEKEKSIADYGNIVCAIGGGMVYEYLVMHLVERFAGHQTAVETAKLLMMNLNAPSPIPYRAIDNSQHHEDKLIAKAQAFMHDHFQDEINLVDLSFKLNISERQFNRRFKKALSCSPQQYLQHFRISQACKKLENSKETVREIVYQIGYQDDSSFRRLFKKHMGIGMSEYREQFGPR